MKNTLIIALLLILPACAKHGVYIDVEKGGQARLEGGWLGNNIVEGTIDGPAHLCVPGKDSLDAQTAPMNWCSEILGKPTPPEVQ